MTFELGRGIITAMACPMNSDYSLNIKSLKKLTGFLLDSGVHGLFANGSQGELYALTDEEKKKVLETVIEEANNKVPVYAGTGATTTHEAISLSLMAQDVGATAVSVITPSFIKPSQEELYEHYAAIAKSIRIPLVLYNHPLRTGVNISGELFERLIQIDNIIGIKDSSGDLTSVAEKICIANNLDKEFSMLAGNDAQIFAILLYGGKGAISATANIVPNLYVQMYEAFMNGDFETAKNIQLKLVPLRLAFRMGTFPVVVKELLNLMGFDVGPARLPVGRVLEVEIEKLKSLLKQLDTTGGRANDQ